MREFGPGCQQRRRPICCASERHLAKGLGSRPRNEPLWALVRYAGSGSDMDRKEPRRLDSQYRHDNRASISWYTPHRRGQSRSGRSSCITKRGVGAPRLRINTVAVGVVRSPGLVNYPDAARPSFDHNPQRRLGDVQDVAQAVAFLGSPATASFITGEVFHVAGGEQIWGEYWALGKPDYFRIDDPSNSPSSR